MATWDPGGILEPNVEVDVIKPVYKFGGQSIQWGEMFSGMRSTEGRTDPLYMIAMPAVAPGFDVLQWFLDSYGDDIPTSNRTIWLNDSGVTTEPNATFFICIQWNAGKCYFGAGFWPAGGVLNPLNNDIPGTTSALYGYGGCDLSDIRPIDHQMATCYFFRHTGLTPDMTQSSPPQTPDSCKTLMIYSVRDRNGNAAPLTGFNVNPGVMVEGEGYYPQQVSSLIYGKYPSGTGNVAWGTGSPPAFMYELIDEYVSDSAETGGGDGLYPGQSGSIGFAELPSVGFDDTGFTRMYAPSLTQVQSLASFLWSDSFLDNIKVSKDNALNCIINLGLLPLKLAVVRGSTQNVKIGNVPSNVAMSVLTEQYITVDMGEVAVIEKWGNALDYEPATVLECFVPFVGFVQLPTSEIMGKYAEGGGKVALQYNVNLFSGEFIAQLKCKNRGYENVLFQYSGTMMYSCPFSAANFSSYYKNIMGGAIRAISSGVSGNLAGAISAAAETTVNSLSPTTVQRSGSISGGSAIMGTFTPYIVRREPKQHLDENGYKILEGYPSYVYRNLSVVDGFVQVEAVKLDGFTGTEDEAKELEILMKEGIYL